MMVVPITAELCNKLRCGLLSQEEVGADTVSSCSAAGYTGVWAASDPRCAAFLRTEALPPVLAATLFRAAGPQPAATPRTGAAPGQSLAPVSLVPPLPSITNQRPQQVTTEQAGVLCQISRWASDHPFLAGAVVLGIFFAARGGKR
jgi:hypothetical protein